MKELNMLGNPCPIPVLTAKKELAQADCPGVLVTVDNFVAIQNLEKMAKGLGYDYSYQDLGQGDFQATITKNGAVPAPEVATAPPPEIPVPTGGATVFITQDQLGLGSEDLGKMLLKGFIFSLTQLDTPPKALLFLNGGVHLTCQGSNVVPDLKTLASQGCKILVCGTCLNYYQKTEALEVGEIGDMYAIVQELSQAHPLITV